MRSLTEAQIKKLTDMPEWMKQPYYDGRVFASAEGWMIRPSKIHPEFPTKQMPAYCIVAIPELSSYMEAPAMDTSVVRETALQSKTLQAQSMSYIRRSASRYMLDISLDEQVYAANGADVEIELDASSIAIGGSATLDGGANRYTLVQSRAGENNSRTGTFRFDLRFTGTLDSLEINSNPTINIVSGTLQNVDDDGVITSIASSAVAKLTIIAP